MIKKFIAFDVEENGKVLIISPQGSEHGFRHETVHHEYNALFRQLEDQKIDSLVVNFGRVDYLGSIMLGVIIRLSSRVTNMGGRVVICCCSEQMMEVLMSQNLHKLWAHFDEQDVAIASFAE